MTAAPAQPTFDPVRQLEVVRRAVAKQSFCVLATASPANRPHAVGILYAAVDLTLYFVMSRDTVKVRNMQANPNVAISIPVRKYPFGPPMAVQFQGTAEVLDPNDPQVQELFAAGKLRRIAGGGTFDKPDICVIRVTPRRRISSYGLGMSLRQLLRDVTAGGRAVDLP